MKIVKSIDEAIRVLPQLMANVQTQIEDEIAAEKWEEEQKRAAAAE